MTGGRLSDLVQYLQRIARHDGDGEAADGQLLEQYVARRDEAAFAVLVRRHGPLVWGVCRRVLHHVQDAEDCFQATFLILARRAGSIGKRESVRSFLYGVAYRVAARARDTAARRQAHEVPLTEVAAADTAAADPDLRPVLDEELARLPARYRVPLILCHLEGRSQEEAARLLGCPRATVATRLARGRDRLRSRLARRGLDGSAGALLPASQAARCLSVPPGLIDTTLGAVNAGPVNARVAALVEEVLRTMLTLNWKLAGLALLALAVAGPGVGTLVSRPPSPAPAGIAAAVPDGGTGVVPPIKQAAGASAPGAALRPPTAAEFADQLFRPVQFVGFDVDPKMTLQEALDAIADRYDLTFDVNEDAFQKEMAETFKKKRIANVLAAPIAEQALPKMVNVSLDTVLRKILSRLRCPSGATYLIRPHVIQITTQAAVRAELGRDEERLPPLVYAVFHGEPLTEALKVLSERAGWSLVVDGRVAEAASTPVTASLANVPLDTAVALLSDMAGLDSAVVDNVCYVTCRENAARLRAQQEQKEQRRQQARAAARKETAPPQPTAKCPGTARP
jgi:RNA polymerase sigma factor (sigma-70 family)